MIRTMLRDLVTFIRPVVAAAALAGLSWMAAPPSPAAAAAGGSRFVTPYACERSGRYRPEQCRNAFANARAELEEASPRFPSRAACERYFKTCAIVDVSPGAKARFGPALDSIEVSSAGGALGVVPVVSAKGIQPSFRSRPVNTLDDVLSPKRRQQAQAAWEAQLRAAQAPPVQDGAAVLAPEQAEPYDENWRAQEGVPTYPGPGARRKGSGEER